MKPSSIYRLEATTAFTNDAVRRYNVRNYHIKAFHGVAWRSNHPFEQWEPVGASNIDPDEMDSTDALRLRRSGLIWPELVLPGLGLLLVRERIRDALARECPALGLREIARYELAQLEVPVPPAYSRKPTSFDDRARAFWDFPVNLDLPPEQYFEVCAPIAEPTSTARPIRFDDAPTALSAVFEHLPGLEFLDAPQLVDTDVVLELGIVSYSSACLLCSGSVMDLLRQHLIAPYFENTVEGWTE